MQIRFRLAHDGIRPSLVRRLRRLEDPRPALEAAGLAIVSLAKRAFDEAGLRPAPWPPRKKRKGKKQPTHKLLKRTGTLWRSLRVIQALKTRVTVGTDRRYAAFHQLQHRAGAKLVMPPPPGSAPRALPSSSLFRGFPAPSAPSRAGLPSAEQGMRKAENFPATHATRQPCAACSSPHPLVTTALPPKAGQMLRLRKPSLPSAEKATALGQTLN